MPYRFLNSDKAVNLWRFIWIPTPITLRKVDATFRMRKLPAKSQKCTAVNKDGFEVDIMRRERAGDDPHPIKLSAENDDFWVAQARRANVLLDSPGFSAVIVVSNGSMARMNTVPPPPLPPSNAGYPANPSAKR